MAIIIAIYESTCLSLYIITSPSCMVIIFIHVFTLVYIVVNRVIFRGINLHNMIEQQE
jgi:hypothetical protein